MFDQRFELSADPGKASPGASRGIWRVPSLRNVELTSPVMHDGRVDRLEDAVRFMAEAQLGLNLQSQPGAVDRTAVWSNTNGRASLVERKSLTDAEVADITMFLRSPTSDRLRASVEASRHEAAPKVAR